MSNQTEAGTEAGDKKPSAKGKGDAAGDSGVPGVIVVMREGEVGFPIGGYSKIADQRGNIGHTLRTVSLMPGLNLTHKLTIQKERQPLEAEGWEQIQKHPQFKRLVDQQRIRVYGKRGEIPKADRITIAGLTVDWLVLEAWFKAEDDKAVRVALQEQMDKLRKQGGDKDDMQVPEVRTTEGIAATF
jgi:hypothetical protein